MLLRKQTSIQDPPQNLQKKKDLVEYETSHQH